MKSLKWWFRVVGAFNLLMGLANVVMIATSPKMLADTLPYPVQSDVTDAFSDAWLLFAFDLVVLGAFLVWASRRPLENVTLAWLAIAMEALHGVVGDIVWIARGYDSGSYIPFIGLHLAVIIWGILAMRSAGRSKTGAALVAG